MEIVALILSLITCILVIILLVARPKSSLTTNDIISSIEKETDRLRQENNRSAQIDRDNTRNANIQFLAAIQGLNDILLSASKQQGENLDFSLRTLAETMHNFAIQTNNKMDSLVQKTDAQLTTMNKTVNEKLTETLEARMNASFKNMTDRLEIITEGFGSIKTMNTKMDSISKVFSNVKTRGGIGETHLTSLLEQFLVPEQYEKQFAVKPTSQERVDFAIKIPTSDNKIQYFPVDAKFPLESFERLCLAEENNNADETKLYQKQLENNIKEQAKSISEKYIFTPKTTDFMVLYLPTEALYAEVAKKPGLLDEIRKKYKVAVCGPTTFMAFLMNIYQSYQTLSIQQQSGELFSVFKQFQKDFTIFAQTLDKTKDHLRRADDTLDDAKKRTELLNNRLIKASNSLPELNYVESKDEDK